jgi:glucose-6-phosphate 1-epimerase
MSQHGFARTAVWTFESLDVAADNSNVTAVFSFSQNEQTLKLWPHAFKLQYTVVLTRKYDNAFV